MVEVRDARGPWGRLCKKLFWGLQVITGFLILGMWVPFAFFWGFGSADPAAGYHAAMLAIAGTTWLLTIWPFGTVGFGLLALLTRGRKRLTPAPLAVRRAGSVPDTGLVPHG